MAIKTPNYALTEAHYIPMGSLDAKTLPAGSFVRPIETRYVPAHVLESKLGKTFDEKLEIMCYTRFGIVPIPKNIIRER